MISLILFVFSQKKLIKIVDKAPDSFQQKVNEILKLTSFKVVIPEHAKNESRLVRCPGTFKVHLSLMKGQKS